MASFTRSGVTAPRPARLITRVSRRRCTTTAGQQQQQNEHEQQQQQGAGLQALASRAARAAVAVAAGALLAAAPAGAAEQIAQFSTSGFLFKDSVKLIALADDKGARVLVWAGRQAGRQAGARGAW